MSFFFMTSLNEVRDIGEARSLLQQLENERKHVQEKFDQEISMLLSFDNPSIVKLYEFKSTNKDYYLFLELCEIGDLNNILIEHFQNSLPEDLSQMFMQQISYAFIEM